MICQQCGQKPVTLHFTKIINGQKTEFHLCESCARDKGEWIPGTANAFSIHNLLSGLLHLDVTGSDSTVAYANKQQTTRCERCGLTYSKFSKSGRFGCDECYSFFGERLNPLLKRVHGSTVHVGKIPKRSGGEIQRKRELQHLKKQLQLSIANEEFEQAAALRDRVRHLENRTGSL